LPSKLGHIDDKGTDGGSLRGIGSVQKTPLISDSCMTLDAGACTCSHFVEGFAPRYMQ
jgi:hypothetical protein